MPGHMKPMKDLKSDLTRECIYEAEYQFKGALCGFGENSQDLNFNEGPTQTQKLNFFP